MKHQGPCGRHAGGLDAGAGWSGGPRCLSSHAISMLNHAPPGLGAEAGHYEGWQGFVCRWALGWDLSRKLAAAPGGWPGVQGWCLWARSPGTCLAALRSSGSHALGTPHTATLEAESQRNFSGPRNGQRQRVCVHWGSAHLSSVPVSWSVHLSGLSSRLLSSPLPSLPSWLHLLSSSLTCWQDEVPRLPPGPTAGLPPRQGVARCCLALWSSRAEWTGHLLPVWPWVWLWVTAPPPGDSPALHHTPGQGCVKGQWPKWASKPGPPIPL